MSEVNHTPTPWRVDHSIVIDPTARTRRSEWHIFSNVTGPDFIAGEASSQANGDFIVRACNAHEALVAALKNAFSVIEEYRRAFDDYNLFLGDDNKRFDESVRDALLLAE